MKKWLPAAAVRCYEHVLRKEKGSILTETSNFEITGRGKSGRPKTTRKKQVKALMKDNSLRKEDTPSRRKSRLAVETVKRNEVNPATFVDGDYTGLLWM